MEKKKTCTRTATYIAGEPLEDRLIKAAFEDNLTLVKEILENHQVDINGKESPNALGWALQNGNEEMANYLVSKGADPNHTDTLPQTFQELVCLLPEPGGFELSMRFLDYKYEKDNPQRCLELYCQEATLTKEILERLIKLGADIHCCNDYPLHLSISDQSDGYRNPQSIAKTVAILRDHGAWLSSRSMNLCGDFPLDIALKNGFIEATKEILKGYGEEQLCIVVRTHREKQAVKLAEKEIEARMRKFPDDILDRYKERASTHLPEFLKFAEREYAKRESEKVMGKLKKVTHSKNTLEI